MPSVAIIRSYEAVYIVDPDIGEEQISTITNRYKQIIETNGGTVAKVDVWERRKLAYMIKGRTEGIYVVMDFSGPAQAETELRRIFQISEDQIRALIVRQDEAALGAPTGEPEANAAPAAVQAVSPVVSPPTFAPAEQEAPAAAAPATPETPAAEEATAALSEADAPALAPEQAPAE